MSTDSQPSTIAEVEMDTGRLVVPPPKPRAWLVTYGDRLEHDSLFLDRAIAERMAVRLHGQVVALYPGPMP